MKLTTYLTKYERKEIFDYDTIYYINLNYKSVQKKLKREDTFSYDDDNWDYKLIVGEHIAYRYEIIDR